MAFNVEAIGIDDAVVIDTTRLFTTDVPEFSGRTRVGARVFDASRSFVERAVSFPENIEVEAIHTYNNPPQEPGAGGRGAPTLRPGSHSVVMHYSMVLLPEKPMQARLFDDRVGYFSTSKVDYSKDEHRAPQRRHITRWRLEKKDPNAALSEPVKPIVYWIDPATPTKWVPYLKKGVESRNLAFEAAGFKNAVIAKDPPTPEQDPEWSPEDARYSVIRWLPSTIENASGPHIHDPRSGEILETDIQFYHNVMNLSRNWYFVQVGALDPRAKTLPLPDDLMGRLVEYVAAHEVGHTLGFQHNMKASSMYPTRVLRLVEQEAVDGAAAYAPLDFLGDVRRGVWSEIYDGGAAAVDAYRRNLQRAYVDTLSGRINGPQAQSDDARAFFRGELKTLDSDLATALGRQSDRATSPHIQDVRTQIARALDPTVQATSAAARSSTDLADDALFDVTSGSDACWPDYAVTPRGKQ